MTVGRISICLTCKQISHNIYHSTRDFRLVKKKINAKTIHAREPHPIRIIYLIISPMETTGKKLYTAKPSP